MIGSCITISLVEQASGGPFVFWDDWRAGIDQAAQLGFDAVELFLPGPDTVDSTELHDYLSAQDMRLAAVGTGAGWVIHQLTLTDPEANRRRSAMAFVKSMIDFGAPFGAPAIIGSMQGWGRGAIDRATGLEYLRDALNELGSHAAAHNVPLWYEPLNRYETNLTNTIRAGVELLDSLDTTNVQLLADLFHMNIEESYIHAGIVAGRGRIGHIHFVDSNRRAAGCGHTNFDLVSEAIRHIEYDGYLSAEAFPLPDSATAAKMTIDAIRHWFPATQPK